MDGTINFTMTGYNRRLIREMLEYTSPRVESGPVHYNYASPDSHSKSFNLEATKLCWKKITGIECAEPSDPRSETGLCTSHYDEIRESYTT